jgi:hypothetical protein
MCHVQTGSIYQCSLPRDLLIGGPEWSGESQLEPELIGGFHDGAYVSIETFTGMFCVRVCVCVCVCGLLRVCLVLT